MHISRLSIANYKSFFQEITFEFQPGINVLLGANSSGKTSVLETIEISKFVDIPHRSVLNVLFPGAKVADRSTVEMSIDWSLREAREALVGFGKPYVAIGDRINDFCSDNLVELSNRFSREGLTLDFRRQYGIDVAGRLSLPGIKTPWRSLNGNTSYPAVAFDFASGQAISFDNVNNSPEDLQSLWGNIAQRAYRFSADRGVVAISGHHADGSLLPTCSNLAYCLNWLQTTNPHLNDQLNAYVHRIFPTIHFVASPPTSGNQFELKIHSVPARENRGDLAVSISQVGTGVFNAIAMLYVVLTAHTQQFLLLEEPNSFLHPRALRELLAILSEIGQKHQFFITTHSSDVLRTVKASTVTLLKYDGKQTSIEQTSGEKLDTLRAGLVDLGVRLTDLHGCDRVLWVEGETEESVFPLILRHFFPSAAEGIAVLPLHATGDFESKRINPAKVAAIYRTLSQGSFLAPPMVGIALDREKKPASLIAQIEKDCDRVVYFLARPMLEDYLLHPTAVAEVINGTFAVKIVNKQVESAIADAKSDPANLLFPERSGDKTLHAAKTLNTLFQRFGSAGASYHKTVHGPLLAKWILQNDPDTFSELKEWMARFAA